MSTKSKLIQKLRRRKDYREAFVASQISTGIPFQIRALRKQFNWSQKDLAEATQMLQPRICAMEQAGYGDFTLNTLKKLAAAFDVGLVVRFAPYGELVQWADNFSPDTFGVPSAMHDPVLTPGASRMADFLAPFPDERMTASRVTVEASAILRETMTSANTAPTEPTQHSKSTPNGAEMEAMGARIAA